MVEVIGTIEEIVFRNEDNGYSVVEIKEQDKDNTITAVGNFPFVNEGEMVRVEGEWTLHPNYGEQLKMETYNTVAPSTIVGMENYLASGLIKGVGPSTAKKLVGHFGLDILDIIQLNPQRLTEVDGIGDSRAEMIASSFLEQQEIREVMVFLQSYRISTNYALKIYKTYGSNTKKILSDNPYRLADDIQGIGFKTADTIARSMGVDANSPYRVMSGVKYVLSSAISDGHTYLPKDKLILKAQKILNVEESLIENAIVSLALNQALIIEEIDNIQGVFLTSLYKAEAGAAKRLRDIAVDNNYLNGVYSTDSLDSENKYNISNRKLSSIKEKIKRFEKQNEIILADQQREAVIQAMSNGVVIITGGPGTGKTTSLNCIIRLFRDEDLKVELAAPTGRAAKRMAEATGYKARTIHRLLEYGYKDEDGGDAVFQKDEENPLKADVVIIDEMSMVDIYLLNSLLKAIVPGTRLIMVGDVDQLPSVGPGNVLRDIINSGLIRVIQLKDIYRQAEESMIIVNAHRINRGEMPFLNVKNKDFFFDRRDSTEKVLGTLTDLIERRLPGYGGYDPYKDIQILAPMRKGIIGVNNLNVELQKVLNPPSSLKKEKSYGGTIYRQADKVMQIRNNYQLKWSKIEEGEEAYEGEGVFNGDMGFIQDIDKEEQFLSVLFDDDKLVKYEYAQLDELELAYAVTIHKSQGSEFPVIIVPLYSGPPMLMTRNLLYTAVTRAKELVVLVGSERMLSKMVDNNHIAKRYSNLSNRLKQAFGIAGIV